MKEKMIEIIQAAVGGCARHWALLIAQNLLNCGAVLPPVKIGQELWDIHYNKPRKWEVVYLGYNGKEWHINIHWWKDRHNFKTLSITYPFVGKMWYFTKEEAGQALKEGVSDV